MTEQPSHWGKWGEQDERGTANFITADVTRRAAQLVRTGRIYPLAIPLEADGPLWPGRHQNWHVATHRNVKGPGLGGAEDILMIPTHGSTHMDALCHITFDGRMYNGFDAEKHIDSRGARRNSIDKVGALVTRGVLIDVARHHGVDHLPADHVITPAEIESIAKAQGTEIGSGDALLFRTGWLTTWSNSKETFSQRQPGIGIEAALWAGTKEIAIMAADNTAVEAYPVGAEFLPVHREFLVNQGGYLMELLDLEALARDRVHEFMFVVAPLNIVNGLGSPITPLAIC